MMHSEAKRTDRMAGVARRGRGVLRAAAGGALLVVGAGVGTLLATGSPGSAVAGEQNYVRSFSHDAVSGVMLDEEVAISFNSALLPSSVGPDTVFIRTNNNSEQARGSYVVGRFLFDKSTQRRVVVRPEAIREYFQIGVNDPNPREDAARLARTLLRNVEATGNLNALRKIDRVMVRKLGSNFGFGTRIDDSAVLGTFPPPQLPTADDDIRAYRTLIAGDDALWQDYLVNGNFNAFATLAANSDFERFHHPVNPATGVPSSQSVLRGREYRKVLIDGRTSTRVMFVPEVPIRTDITDTGYKGGVAYSIVVPASQPGVFNTVLTRNGRRPLLQANGRDASTLFTTIPNSANAQLFFASEATQGVGTWQTPRVINQTPPIGETFVDPTTDWEDPDNQFTTPVAARRTFSVRLRFAQPLDPRTVSTLTFTLTKTKSNPGPSETTVNVPVAVGTFLNQRRLGLVEVEVTPATNLDPASQYEVRVSGLVKSLHGELLNIDYRGAFIVGPGAAPLDKIQEKFGTPATNKADPLNADTLGLVTTAFWPTPQFLDPTLEGRLTANFMPFAGTGLGARENPLDPGSNIVTDLIVPGGSTYTYITEDTDPLSANFGRQVEYNFFSINSTGGAITALGRYPLVLRSQTDINLTSAQVSVKGFDGGTGRMNSDTVNGGPTGGLGGRGGAGGYRGGDGAFAPLTDALGEPVADGLGNLQFDQTKFNGTDGLPSYLITGVNTGGAGAGGFSGDQDTPVTGDFTNQSEPTHVREAGGGGGHATVGANGSGSGGSTEVTAGGYNGGAGGLTYGVGTFADQPLNAVGAPVMGLGAGGAGGGGGGGEDDAQGDLVGDGIAGPEDAGGGGGGGGGGGIHLVARNAIFLSGTLIDARGGEGGGTVNAGSAPYGQGAPGGCGAGGSIWLQCYGSGISIVNGSQILANGGTGTNSVGQITQAATGGQVGVTGNGGAGGDGYIRFEDSDGSINIDGASLPNVRGVRSDAAFRPEADGSYPGRGANDQMIVNDSIAYSRWFNSQLDTPSYRPLFDDPLTPEIDGTLFFDFAAESGGSIQIQCRTAPGDPAAPGRPNLAQATAWTDYADIGTISDRRYIQFRVIFSLPVGTYSFSEPRPYVRCFVIDVETN